MRKILTGVIVVLVGGAVAAPVAWSGDRLAQSTDKGGQMQEKGGAQMLEKGELPGGKQPGEAQQIEGKIQKVIGNTVTLADGTQLTIPRNAQIERKELKPGANIRASYEENGGQKMVISLEVERAR